MKQDFFALENLIRLSKIEKQIAFIENQPIAIFYNYHA